MLEKLSLTSDLHRVSISLKLREISRKNRFMNDKQRFENAVIGFADGYSVGHKKAAGKIASGHTQIHISELKTSWYLTPPDRGQQKTAHTKGYGGRKYRISAFSSPMILTLSAHERHKKSRHRNAGRIKRYIFSFLQNGPIQTNGNFET